MAIKKNPPSSDFDNSKWYSFAEDANIRFQPIGAYYVVDVHNIKAIQKFFLSIPCGLDDLGECRLHDSVPIRKVLFWQGWDPYMEEFKYLKLPKTAARDLINLI